MKLNLKEFFGQKANTKWLVIIFIVGIGLLLLPDLFTPPQTQESPVAEANAFDRVAYEQELEARLAEILSTLRGVSDVSVMVTLEDSGETYYARNESTDEKASGDGALSERTSQSDGALALKSESGGGQSPVLLKTGMPRVAGVLVTARGVGAMDTRANVITAVQAALNVAVHRVAVLEKA